MSSCLNASISGTEMMVSSSQGEMPCMTLPSCCAPPPPHANRDTAAALQTHPSQPHDPVSGVPYRMALATTRSSHHPPHQQSATCLCRPPYAGDHKTGLETPENSGTYGRLRRPDDHRPTGACNTTHIIASHAPSRIRAARGWLGRGRWLWLPCLVIAWPVRVASFRVRWRDRRSR